MAFGSPMVRDPQVPDFNQWPNLCRARLLFSPRYDYSKSLTVVVMFGQAYEPHLGDFS